MQTHMFVQEFDRSALQATSDATLTTKAIKLWTPATAAAYSPGYRTRLAHSLQRSQCRRTAMNLFGRPLCLRAFVVSRGCLVIIIMRHNRL
ncbi:MAG: hypothetical protein M0Q43_07975 [Methanothrix sp.]|nr:hypothetical protein [Methanothrix sp.]